LSHKYFGGVAEWSKAVVLSARGGSALGGKTLNELTMACIYVLYSQSREVFYIGSSREKDSEKRIVAHNSGKTKSTKFGRPWIIIHDEQFPSYTEARKRELFLKSGVGRNWIYKKFPKWGI